MKLCVLGPADNTAERNTAIVKRAFPELEVYQVSYQVYTEALDLIDEIQEEADAILFPGKASYRLCEKNRVPLVPWEYIPRHVSSLHRTMLEVQTKYQCGLSNISYDTLDRELILSAYEEIGIPHKNARFFLAEQHLLDPGYLPYLIEFHTTNYLRKGAACCITGLTEIAGELRQRKIPCAVTLPASALIVDTARKLQLRYEAKQNLENWIVVIMVKLTYSGNYSLLGKDDYGYITNRIKVLESVYTYSYRIDGTVVEDGSDGFLIFTTRRAIALETGQFKNFYLLDMLDGCRAENVAAGIGCGRTASESKSNAYAAMELSKKAKGNCAYVILEDGSVLRPMRPGRKDSKEEIDQGLAALARRTKLSSNTIYTIWKSTKRSAREEFTSKQLADLCGFNVRTMDRILQKLLAVGCCSVVGMVITEGHGRPSRIFRFHWEESL